MRRIQVDRIGLDDGDPSRLRQLDQAGDRPWIDAGGGNQDERRVGAGEEPCRLVDARRIRKALTARLAPRG